MFLFNESPGIQQSIEHNFFGLDHQRSDRGSPCFFFSGPIPNSINDLPFDLGNPIEMVRNSVGHILLEWGIDIENRRFNYENPLVDFNNQSQHLFKQHYFDDIRSMWRLMPKLVAREFNIESFDRTDTQSVDDAYRDCTTYSVTTQNDPNQFQPGNTINQFYFSRNRYPYNEPLIVEYEQQVTLDLIAFQQTHSGSLYDNTGMTIEMWDPSLNEGAGDWTNSQSISYGGGNTQNEVDLTGRGLTSTKFRVFGNDTGSRGWIMKYFAFFSNTEPTVVPFDATWALLGTMYHGIVSLHTGNDYNFAQTNIDSAYDVPSFPYALISLGDAGTEGSMLLQQKNGIDGKVFINPRILTFAFE